MANLKILVIDDDPATCRLLEMVLQMDDYETTSASAIEGGDVIALLNKERPHILIMDVHLGSQDTLAYVQAIRADSKWQHLPLLITSAINHRQESLNAGASDFILKPFNWLEISQVVNQIRNQLLPE